MSKKQQGNRVGGLLDKERKATPIIGGIPVYFENLKGRLENMKVREIINAGKALNQKNPGIEKEKVIDAAMIYSGYSYHTVRRILKKGGVI